MDAKTFTHTIDFQKIKTPDDLHAYFKKEFAFPDYYGMNWDAFWDCMTDVLTDDEPINIEIRSFSQFEKNYPLNANIMKKVFVHLLEYDKESCRKVNAYLGREQKHPLVKICYIDTVNEGSGKEK